MVFTLHRYIFRELMKVFIMASVALTVMLSLGGILRPVQEYGVGPGQVIQLMGYFLPITLTFVLPMAALFSAALVYGRFACDNELDACRASGISIATLVYPGLILAIIVAIANLLLSFHVMPEFVQRAEASLKTNAKQILFRNIERQGYYKLPSDSGSQHIIYADQVNAQEDTLAGVVVVEMAEGKVQEIITAEIAKIQFTLHHNVNQVRVTARNACQMDSQAAFYTEDLSVNTEFGSLLQDDIQFKKINEMKRIRDVDPMFFTPIATLARQVHTKLTAELLAQDIVDKIATAKNASPDSTEPPERADFYKLHSGKRFIQFTANNCLPQNKDEIQLTGNVVLIESDLDTQQVLRTLMSEKALIHVEADQMVPTLTMELRSPIVRTADGQENRAWGWMRFRGLILPPAVKAEVDKFRTPNSLRTDKLTSESDLTAIIKQPTPILENLQWQLNRKIRNTLVDIEAELHSRLVFGVGCVAMIMIGIGLGILLKGGHLLSAFGASCLPAAVLIVCILSGKRIAENTGASEQIGGAGIALMWAGLLILSFIALAVYRRLLKN